MRTTILWLLVLPVIAACSKQAPEAPPPAPATEAAPADPPSVPDVPLAPPAPVAPVLSADSYGPVRFGTTLAQAERDLGTKSIELGEKDPACHSVRFPSLPGVRFMVENGIVTRADADRGVANTLGLKVGDTLAEATSRHASLEVGPHKYVTAGHYLTMRSPDRAAAIVMEEDGKAITKIRAGLMPSVSYVETCL